MSAARKREGCPRVGCPGAVAAAAGGAAQRLLRQRVLQKVVQGDFLGGRSAAAGPAAAAAAAGISVADASEGWMREVGAGGVWVSAVLGVDAPLTYQGAFCTFGRCEKVTKNKPAMRGELWALQVVLCNAWHDVAVLPRKQSNCNHLVACLIIWRHRASPLMTRHCKGGQSTSQHRCPAACSSVRSCAHEKHELLSELIRPSA